MKLKTEQRAKALPPERHSRNLADNADDILQRVASSKMR